MKDSDDPLPPVYAISGIFLLTMNASLIMAIVLLLAMLLFSALISGSEVAFFSLNKEQLGRLEEEGDKAQRVIRLRNQPRKLLGTILVANNFVNIGIVVVSEYIIWNFFSEELFVQWAESLTQGVLGSWMSVHIIARILNFIVTVFSITFLLVLFGEIAPKIYARIHNVRVARFMALPLDILMRLFSPLTHGLVSLSNAVENRLQRNTGTSTNVKQDLDKAIVLTVIDEEDSKEEADILRGIVKFNEVTVKQIMRNRVDVVAINVESNFKEVLDEVQSSGYSRIPVYQDDLDQVVGILYVKDLIEYLDEKPGFQWTELVSRDILYVPETKKINDLMKAFQEKRMHMAIVVDEYGGSSGIVTLEDVMEEVIGEIKDEKDLEEEFDFVKVDQRTYIFDGKTQINDLCRIMDVDSNDFHSFRGEADTIAGLILENHGLIPKKGQEFNITEKYMLKVMDVSPRRIERVQVKIIE